jgi:hypothetical protein
MTNKPRLVNFKAKINTKLLEKYGLKAVYNVNQNISTSEKKSILIRQF